MPRLEGVNLVPQQHDLLNSIQTRNSFCSEMASGFVFRPQMALSSIHVEDSSSQGLVMHQKEQDNNFRKYLTLSHLYIKYSVTKLVTLDLMLQGADGPRFDGKPLGSGPAHSLTMKGVTEAPPLGAPFRNVDSREDSPIV